VNLTPASPLLAPPAHDRIEVQLPPHLLQHDAHVDDLVDLGAVVAAARPGHLDQALLDPYRRVQARPDRLQDPEHALLRDIRPDVRAPPSVGGGSAAVGGAAHVQRVRRDADVRAGEAVVRPALLLRRGMRLVLRGRPAVEAVHQADAAVRGAGVYGEQRRVRVGRIDGPADLDVPVGRRRRRGGAEELQKGGVRLVHDDQGRVVHQLPRVVVVQQPQEARRRAGCGAVGGVESRLVDALLSRSERDGEGGCHVAARNFGLGLGEGRLLFPYFYIHRELATYTHDSGSNSYPSLGLGHRDARVYSRKLGIPSFSFFYPLRAWLLRLSFFLRPFYVSLRFLFRAEAQILKQHVNFSNSRNLSKLRSNGEQLSVMTDTKE
jgi:hypothetical protein